MLSAAQPARLIRARHSALNLGTEHVWGLLALATPFVLVACAVPLTTDTWWALAMGRLEVAAGRPLDTVLAHAPVVAEHPNGQWLAQIVLYGLYAGLGTAGVRTATALLIAVAFGLVLAMARAAGGSPRIAACAVLLGALMAASNFTVRSQVFSYLLFAGVAFVLQVARSRPRLLLVLPPMFGLWANFHGAFLFGLVLVGLHLAGEGVEAIVGRVKSGTWNLRWVWRLGLTLLGSAGAACLNPLGPRVFAYVANAAGDASARSLISEWQPTSLHDPTGAFFFGSVLLLFLVLRAARRPVGAVEALVLLGFGLLGLESGRYVVWWALLLPPILARHAAAIRLPGLVGKAGGRSQGGSAVNLVAAGVIVLVAGLAPFWPSAAIEPLLGSRSSAVYAPAAAADFVATLPEGARLFHYQQWSGYLAWRLWPRQQPMLDGRVEAHPGSVWADYTAVEQGVTTWESILDRYGVEYLVLDRTAQGRLAALAEQSGRWTPLYRDRTAVVLGRR